MNRETIVKNLNEWAAKLKKFDRIEAEWGLASAEWWIDHARAEEFKRRERPGFSTQGKMVLLEEVEHLRDWYAGQKLT